MTPPSTRLSKSRFVAGCQCHKLLWWKVHDSNAVELQPGKVLQDRFDQGRQVGELARNRYPGGVLIDLPFEAGVERVAATKAALDQGSFTSPASVPKRPPPTWSAASRRSKLYRRTRSSTSPRSASSKPWPRSG